MIKITLQMYGIGEMIILTKSIKIGGCGFADAGLWFTGDITHCKYRIHENRLYQDRRMIGSIGVGGISINAD